MPSAGWARWSRAGFSLAELSVVIAVIGTLFALSIPTFLTYYQSAQVRGAASDMASYLNQGRQLAIQRNRNVCVSIAAAAVQYHLDTCATAAELMAGTDAAGNIRAPDGIGLARTADPIFTNLGAASTAGTVTVTQGSKSLSVVVSASGRVNIGP